MKSTVRFFVVLLFSGLTVQALGVEAGSPRANGSASQDQLRLVESKIADGQQQIRELLLDSLHALDLAHSAVLMQLAQKPLPPEEVMHITMKRLVKYLQFGLHLEKFRTVFLNDPVVQAAFNDRDFHAITMLTFIFHTLKKNPNVPYAVDNLKMILNRLGVESVDSVGLPTALRELLRTRLDLYSRRTPEIPKANEKLYRWIQSEILN